MTQPQRIQRNTTAEGWGRRLRAWRRLNNMKQAGLASLLGVSQPTVARWEKGLDLPSAERMNQIRDLVAGTLRDELALERVLIARQSTIRALMNLDGLTLSAVSAGYRALWPDFSTLIGKPLADHAVNESRAIIEDTDLMRDIRRGSVGLISGISDRHMDIDMDGTLRHRWHICMRRYGMEMYADIMFEPYDGEDGPGIDDVVDFDTFHAPVI